jgi:CheY-like chemotaxis protein
MSDGAKAETVFVVDDDREVRESLRTLLQLDGYKVKTARDGQHALEQLRDGLRPCIILLDLMMPGMDGRHFRAEQLRDPELAHIPVLIFSRHHDPQENAASLGPAAHLRKPAYIDTVLQLIEAHCVRQHGSKHGSRSPAPERPAVLVKRSAHGSHGHRPGDGGPCR